jgi:hypothetical protein
MSSKQKTSKIDHHSNLNNTNSSNKHSSFDKFKKQKAFIEVSFEDRFSWEQIIVMDKINLNDSELRPRVGYFLNSLASLPEFTPYIDSKKQDNLIELFSATKFNNIYQIFDTILAYLFPLNLPNLSDPINTLLYIPKQIIK